MDSISMRKADLLQKEKVKQCSFTLKGMYRESRMSAGTVHTEQRFRLLNRFSLFNVLPTTAASFDANKSLLCLLS